MSENNGGSMMGGFLLGAVTGAVVGAGLALIFAPMAGDETRRQISDTARKLKDGTLDRMEGVKSVIRERAGDVSAAVEAGKDAFRRNADGAPLSKDNTPA